MMERVNIGRASMSAQIAVTSSILRSWTCGQSAPKSLAVRVVIGPVRSKYKSSTSYHGRDRLPLSKTKR